MDIKQISERLKVSESEVKATLDKLGVNPGEINDDTIGLLAEQFESMKLAAPAKPSGGKITKSGGRGQLRKKDLKKAAPEIPTIDVAPVVSGFALSNIETPGITLQRQALALRTVERFRTNEQLIGEVAACDQAVDDDLVCGLLQLYNFQISEVLDISYDEIFAGTAADRKEVWDQYTEACRVLNAETDQFIQQTLSQPSGVSRWKVGATQS